MTHMSCLTVLVVGLATDGEVRSKEESRAETAAAAAERYAAESESVIQFVMSPDSEVDVNRSYNDYGRDGSGSRVPVHVDRHGVIAERVESSGTAMLGITQEAHNPHRGAQPEGGVNTALGEAFNTAGLSNMGFSLFGDAVNTTGSRSSMSVPGVVGELRDIGASDMVHKRMKGDAC